MTDFAALDLTGFTPATLADQPQPMLIWAELDQLVIDRRYQREISAKGRAAIQRIADGFDWRKFQPILVAPAPDGQHRAHAAALAGLDRIPAMTVPMTLTEQAAGFAAINRDRIAIHATQIYRAELAAGTDWAIACRDAVAAAGCHLATSYVSGKRKVPGTVYAIGLVRGMVARGAGAVLTAGLRAIRDSASGDVVEMYGAAILGAWLSALEDTPPALTRDLSAVLDGTDLVGLHRDARTRAARRQVPARTVFLADLAELLRPPVPAPGAVAALGVGPALPPAPAPRAAPIPLSDPRASEIGLCADPPVPRAPSRAARLAAQAAVIERAGTR